jgi:hypothetical protein
MATAPFPTNRSLRPEVIADPSLNWLSFETNVTKFRAAFQKILVHKWLVN